MERCGWPRETRPTLWSTESYMGVSMRIPTATQSQIAHPHRYSRNGTAGLRIDAPYARIPTVPDKYPTNSNVRWLGGLWSHAADINWYQGRPVSSGHHLSPIPMSNPVQHRTFLDMRRIITWKYTHYQLVCRQTRVCSLQYVTEHLVKLGNLPHIV